MRKKFIDRADAGKFLASKLTAFLGRPDTLVLALPRGGVPVGYEVARALGAPLDVFVVRKLGAPGQEELAMGAVASGGIRVVNEDIVASLDVSERELDAVAARELEELARRERLFRGDRPPVDVTDKAVILVDDGLATGATMRAAAAAIQSREPSRLVLAAPVAAYSTRELLVRTGLEIICGRTPEPFGAVGFWYEDFRQTTDEEVIELLRKASEERSLRAN